MPLYSTAAQNNALDAMWGASHATTMPASFEVALISGDPRQVTPTEMDYPGYARVAATNDASFWNDAADGVKTSVLTAFPDSTAAGTVTADFWGIYVAGALYDFGRLAEDIFVSGAGTGPKIRLKVRFNKELI